MDKSTLKELVKSYFSLIDAPKVKESVAEKFASVTLVDGTEVTNSQEGDFEVGQEVYVRTEDGELVSAPEGEHVSSSGITLVVNGEGRLTGLHHPDGSSEGSLTEMAEAGDIAEDVVERAIESGMTPDEVLETVKEVVDTVIAPQLEEMRSEMAQCMERLAKYEERMAEEPATMSAQQRKFAALEKVKATKGEGKTFDPKAAQLEAVLSKIKKNK